ncbi:MAG: small subunit ribosomal protein S17 [Candidatus Peregrinibacteria bacterium Gr01-1014_25]|nr:MAG: small subunit ribosomal protein S17 [Candidatus Peregrinibacteria bacterium Gr01-1014_25]
MITKQGIITSAKMRGTVTVTTHRNVFHPLYKKRFRVSKKFLADAAGMDLHEGDEVVIQECRPLSKRKRFKVIEIRKAAPRTSELAEDMAVHKAIHRDKIAPQASKPSTSPTPSA